jgi:hypothetical protein
VTTVSAVKEAHETDKRNDCNLFDRTAGSCTKGDLCNRGGAVGTLPCNLSPFSCNKFSASDMLGNGFKNVGILGGLI